MARPLSRGVTGQDVKELQAALNFHLRKPFAPLKPDGTFGPATDARVREFQKRAGLTVDGVVGPKTAAALFRTLGGAFDATITPAKPPPAPPARRFGPVFAQVAPIIPDFVPPRPPALPQTRTASSEGFEMESKLVFDPFAKPSKGDSPIKVGVSVLLPWPVFLPKPIKLDIDTSSPTLGGTQLDAKVKVPFDILPPTSRLGVKPYFFVGGGVDQNNYVDLNAGAGSEVRLKLVKNIAGTGIGLTLSADGGVKYKYDRAENEGKFKGYFEGSVLLTGEF